jgi:cyclophilin family peptidyl-prolyl cis-trans isomerase
MSLLPPLRLATTRGLSCTSSISRHFGTGSRGARGHGWYVNYREGTKGGRHLRGEYFERDFEECSLWNQSVLQLGSTQVYLDVVAAVKSDGAEKEITGDEERHRLKIDLASTVMSETTDNFLQLVNQENGYKGSILYRFERNVGVCGGDVLSNTGKTGKAALGTPLTAEINDPLAMWHLPGTVSMLVPKVGEIDSRFMLLTQTAHHLDGIHRVFGQMQPESLATVEEWVSKIITRDGRPSSYDLVIVDCGVLEEAEEQTA